MKKLNVITAALLLSITSNCVTAAHHFQGDVTPHGDANLGQYFQTQILPKNSALSSDPTFREITAFEKVSGLQGCQTPQIFPRTQVSVENTDTVTSALQMLQAGLTTPVILNLANKTVPGGGVLKGAKAQEEDLCRKTTLYASIKAAEASGHYPLAPFEAIYSPKVWAHGSLAVRNSFASISMAGYRMTSGFRDKADHPGDRPQFIAGMQEKIKVVLSTAIAHGHSNIILGALGCGAFAKVGGKVVPHIPVDVADAFNAVLNTPYSDGVPFANHFQNIVFAILETGAETLNPTFKSALGITQGNSTTLTLSPAPRAQATTLPTAHPSHYAAPATAYPSHYEVTTPTGTPLSKPSIFDTRASNIEAILKRQAGISSVFTGGNVEVKLLNQTPWTAHGRAWPVMIKSYTEKAGQWKIICSFAHNGSLFEVDVNGHWKSLSREARAWLKKVTKQ